MRIGAAGIGVVLLGTALSGTGSTVRAQDVPWIAFEDERTGAACDVVNAGVDKLVVLLDGSVFTIVTGPDRVLDDSFVDENWQVFFEGLDASLGGSIEFAFDRNGNLGLWWVWPTGHVMEIDDFSGELLITDLFPGDYPDSVCLACDEQNVCHLWDDLGACGFEDDYCEPPDPPEEDLPPITIEICGNGIPISVSVILASLIFLRFSRGRAR